MEVFPASKVHLQPATWLSGKTYVQILLASLGVVQGQIQTFSEGVVGLG